MHSPATGMLIAEEVLDGRAHTIDIDEESLASHRGTRRWKATCIHGSGRRVLRYQ